MSAMREPPVELAVGGTVAGLVLAAGLGRRFGGAKLAATLDGKPLLGHVLDTARRARDEGILGVLVVVVPAGPDGTTDAHLLQRLAEESGAIVAANDDPAAGLSRSLRLGLTALETVPGSPRVDAALVLLGDQPRTWLEVMHALVAEWRRSRAQIVIPRYRGDHTKPGAPGNPVLLAREAWPLARRLRGDTGMRAVAQRHPELVSYLDVEGTNPDVDEPRDLDALAGSSV